MGHQSRLDNETLRTLELKAWEYEVLRYADIAVRRDFDPYFLKDVYRASIRIFVQEIETVSYRWPKDWWEALKERFAPSWVKRRWPVVYTTKGHAVGIYYPELALPNHENSHKVVVQHSTH